MKHLLLLQDYMPYTGKPESVFDNPIIFWGVIIVAFFIGVLITRMIFSIPTILKHQKAQTILLLKIARANGLNDEEMKNVIEVIHPDETKINSSMTLHNITKGF